MAKAIVRDLLHIFKTSVSAVLPENLIRKSLKYNPGNQDLIIVGDHFNISNKNVYLVGTGKAVQNMAKEVENVLGSKIKRGIISIPSGSFNHNSANKNILYCEGAINNLPDSQAENTAKIIKDLVSKLEVNDLLLVLISGGGSALLPLPKPPISLEEKTMLIKKLANSGADIKELNTVRKRISDVKGGQLAIKAQPAQVISLILSDIVGDPLDLIASGPTTENEDNPNIAIEVIKKYKLFDDLPESIKKVLLDFSGKDQFPKDNVWNHIIGSNKISIEAALEEARNLKYCAIELSNAVTGDVKDIAKEYVTLTKSFCGFLNGFMNIEDLRMQVSALNITGLKDNYKSMGAIGSKDLCIILGGEITVQVSGNGIGGRNQQLALEFSNFIHKIKDDITNFDVYFLSAGTDGIDGPTDAAGAIGYLDLVTDAKSTHIEVDSYIKNNDSYNFYREFKNGSLHVITGHTNTNVMDIHIILIKRKRNIMSSSL